MSDRGGEEVTPSFNWSSVTNQNEVNNLTDCVWNDSSAHPFFLVVYTLVFLVGFLLNGFIMFYFCRAQQKPSSNMMIYLKNLVVADFLLSLSLPIRITNYATSSATIHQVNCNFGYSILFLNMYASIMFMGYIAANRYLKVVQPLGTHILQSVRVAHIISTVTWVFLLAVTCIYIILSFHTQKTFTSVRVSCQGSHSGQHTLLYKVLHVTSCFMFLSVLGSVVFFYCSISRRVSLAQQRHPASSNSKKLAKSRRNMLVLVIVFCFCFVPYHLIRLPKVFLWRYCSWAKVFYYGIELTVVMASLNVCLDPVIYFVLCKEFRTQLRLGVVRGN
ncbi:P2Y purinoceptor 14-like [Etheostoma cragini]|uniref:P2Y purinoceptor 14-like n=1 Tax=Etheostoma cragini TaxID=417921 RepID=UPI00155E7FEE|nr:P2Y purinoceptor 14-like [Etheostoma cragini]